MRAYWLKLNWLYRLLRPSLVWEGPKTLNIDSKKSIYLSFDDGPTPEVTDWVLDLLDKEQIKATFFLIGKNILEHPEIYKRIKSKGHRIGNHTENHFKGSKKTTAEYLENISKCQKRLDEKPGLFRPPYGRIKSKQIKAIQNKGFQIIMWSVLSGDWDSRNKPKDCSNQVLSNVDDGSIIVYHDSLKAKKNLYESLPQVIRILKQRGFEFKPIP